MTYYALVIPQKCMWIFTNIEDKESITKNMAEKFGESNTIMYSADKLDSYVFDDGLPSVKPEHKITIDVPPFKLKFYIQDLTSLKFELKSALKWYKDDRYVRVSSNYCESYMSPETAVRIHNYLVDHQVELEAKEKSILASAPLDPKHFIYNDADWGAMSPDVEMLQ